MCDKYEMDIIYIYVVDKFKVFINRIYIYFFVCIDVIFL